MSKHKQQKNKVTGFIKRHPDGFGFLIPDQADFPDVYIPKKFMIGIMSNDKVEVSVEAEPGGKRFRGRILQIVSRGTKRVTGQLHRMKPGQGVLLDTSKTWGENLHVELSGEDFNEGDWVVIDVVTYPGSEEGFAGKLVKVIGDGFNPNNDNMRVLLSQSVPMEFSKKTLNEAEDIPAEVSAEDKKGRRDLRSKLLITIDGATAKDFDDAICVEKTAKGFLVYVAIADVSHYVRPGSAIDKDAYERGTSTYLPNFVSPMLPEKLSNHLCSLRPNEDRLSVVAEIHLDFQAETLSTQFYEAVINSKARVTYGEAQEIVDGHNDGQKKEKFSHVENSIKIAADLAKILMAKRAREGSLNLEIPSTQVEVDDAGQPVDIIKSERIFAHCLIEELMLIANVEVARFLNRREVPALFRIHESPEGENIKFLENFMHNMGVKVHLEGGKLQKKITRALEEFRGQPQEHILHILTLRSMKQAVYSADNVGHFGLGFTDYVHFTSPIRRYPDLIIHRQLKAVICPEKGYAASTQEELDSCGQFLSACEQRSVKAERQLVSIKKARFMEKFVGQTFEGVVSSVAKFGVFVLLRRYDVDGLVRLEELGDDYFEFDDENLRLVGRRSGTAINIGDPMEVLVAAVDTDAGRVDFAPANAGVKKQKEGVRFEPAKFDQKKNQSAPARLSLKTNRRGLRKTRVSKPRGKSKAR